MKALYLFSGQRKRDFSGIPSVDFPDTQLYGQNHIKDFGIDSDGLGLDKVVPTIFISVLGFRFSHFLSFFYTKKYDIVFGPSLLYTLFWKKIFKTNTKFVLLNISFNRVLNTSRGLKKYLVLWLAKELDGIISLSNYQTRSLKKEMSSVTKLFTVYLGVDIKYHSATYEGREDFLLSVGRDNGRDYRTVVEVAKSLPSKEFVFVCSRRNLVGLSVPENVTVHYDLPYGKVRELYRSAGILLLITHDDSFRDGSDCSGQTVLLDGMASGLPVIVTKKNYLKDYVSENVDVRIIPAHNTETIVEAINASENGDLVNKMAHTARNRVEKYFSTRNMAKQLGVIFKSIHEKI